MIDRDFVRGTSRTPRGGIKVRRQRMPKVILYQYLIAAVLFRPSQELWRISGGERQNSGLPPFRQSGAIRKEARKYWGF
jgi:hypothetical protein